MENIDRKLMVVLDLVKYWGTKRHYSF
jgi:hypothetical protein